MDIVTIWNYLNKHYKIIHFKVCKVAGFYITELILKLTKNPLNQPYAYSSGCHPNRSLSLLKAVVEIIERLVFISPFVGPIEFINEEPYVVDFKGQFIPLNRVSPYFSKQAEYNSRGHACYDAEEKARVSSIYEYYESVVTGNIDYYLKNSELNTRDINLSHSVDGVLMEPHILEFEIIVIKFFKFYFSLVWYPRYADIAIGSACGNSYGATTYKAFIEAVALLDAVANSARYLVKTSKYDLNKYTSGYYMSKVQIKKPAVIKRHSNILSDLNLYLYQAVKNV